MKAVPAFLDKLAKRIVEVLAILLFGGITVLGAFRSVWLAGGYDKDLAFVKDSLFFNLLAGAVLFFLMKVIADFICKNQAKRTKILLIVTLVYTFVVSLGWAAVSKCFPTADQASVYYGAKHFAANYYVEIAGRDSYFSCYPHQMGLALFYEWILRLFHTESYHLLQGVNALCNVLIGLSLFKLTELLFPGKKVPVYMLLLHLTCLPLFWYTPFVYGELPSLAFSFCGMWLFLEAIGQSQKWKKLLFLTASLSAITIASLVRKNTMIFVLALLITLFVWILKEKKYFYFIYMILLAICCTMAIPVAIRRYEHHAGNQLNDGVPGISHVVMGLQDNDNVPGWYNGYNFETYAYKADYDQKKAIAISRADLQERLQTFRENTAYTVSFFTKKFMGEWLNTGYGCIEFTSGKYYDRLPFVESLYSGKAYEVLRSFMDKYQFFVYGMALLFIAQTLFEKKAEKKEFSVMRYTFLAAILGGALFYLVWEGSGRYILPYFFMTLPYCAAGMANLEAKIFKGEHK